MANEPEPKVTSKLVNKKQLLEQLFDETSRPSMRWLNYQIAARGIPFFKIGARVFFDLDRVREKLARKNLVGATVN